MKSIPEKNAWVKVRVQKTTTATNFALACQGLIKNYGKWTLGGETAGVGDKNTTKFGAQIDINL